MLYAARVADKRDQYEGRELIRARVAVWRADAWTSWLPAMMVLPVVMIGGTFFVDTLRAWLRPSFREAGPLDVAVVAALACAPMGLMLGIAYGIRRLTPHSKGRHWGLAIADLIGRGVTLILVVIAGLWVGGGLSVGLVLFVMGEERAPDAGESLDMIGVVASAVGAVILTGWVGIRRRVELRCARCGYQIGSVRRAPEVCTECGNQWKRIGGLDRFRRISVWWLVGGLGLIVVGSVVRYFAWY